MSRQGSTLSLETATKGPSGTLALATRTSKAGRSYHAITWCGAGSSREVIVPVFGNELTWVLDSLDVLSTDVSLDGISEEGSYPIASRIHASGGLAWDADCDHEAITLTIRRFNNSVWKKEQSFYTRYFVPAKSGWAQQKASIPRQFVEDGAFLEFVEEVRSKRQRIRDHLLGTLKPPPLGEFDLFRQVVVGGKLADYATESLAQGVCLERPVPQICLDHCTAEQSALELSDVLPISAKEIAHILGWTQRYSPTVLADSFLFSPRTETIGDRYLAVRQRDLFRCDPLLSCLDPGNRLKEGEDNNDSWVRAPQCKAVGFQRAIESGLTSGLCSTAWGRAPVPEVGEARKSRTFVRIHSSMRKHRYKILQLAWRASAEISNFAGGVSRDPVLCYQLMALLRHDVASLFEDEQEELLGEMRVRMNAALAGKTRAVATNEWEELPRRGED